MCSLTTDLLCGQRTKKNSQIKCEINVRSRVRSCAYANELLVLDTQIIALSFCLIAPGERRGAKTP